MESPDRRRVASTLQSGYDCILSMGVEPHRLRRYWDSTYRSMQVRVATLTLCMSGDVAFIRVRGRGKH
jgi:hypothetical protein